MGRVIWTKLQADPNDTWTRHEGEPPFSVPVIGGLAYDVSTDAGDYFTITPLTQAEAPVLSGQPVVAGIAQVGQTLTATAAPSSGTAPITTAWQWLRDGVDLVGATGTSYALTEVDNGTAISVRQTDSNAEGSDSATSAALVVQPATTGGVAAITGLFMANQVATGEVTLTYSISADSAVAGVLTRSATTPTAAQIAAGQDHLGAPAASSFTDTWTTGGSDTLPDIAAGLPSDLYYLHVLPAGGDDLDVVSSNGANLETERPVALSASSSASGDQIDITFSETLLGATTTADWGLTADNVDLPVSAVSIVNNVVTLTLSSLIGAGQALALSYTGTDLSDSVANPVAGFSDQGVTNTVTGGFTENSVTVPAGASLTAPELLPADVRSLLFFASLTQQIGHDTRSALATWAGVSGGFHSQYNSGSGTCGIRLRLQGGSANLNQTSTPVQIGTRYHVLVSAWTDDAQMQVIAYLLNTATGTWENVIQAAAGTTPGTVFDLTTNNLHLFARSDKAGQNFAGTVNRVALWTGTGGAPIADITQAAVRDGFATASGMADPALSRVQFGQPLVDFHGTAADYAAGTHNGSLGDFSSSGTFG